MTGQGDAIGLKPADLDRVFPFHFVLDEESVIIQVGGGLMRHCPQVAVGSRATEVFSLERPLRVTFDYGDLLGARESFYLVTEIDTGIELRGGIICDQETNTVAFLCGLRIRDLKNFDRLKLERPDMPPTDPLTDLLFMMRIKDRTLEDARNMANELSDLNEALLAEREHVAQLHRHSRSIVDSALDAVITIDDASLITAWNPQAERIFGWTATEAIGRDPVDLIVPERFRAAHIAGRKAYAKRKPETRRRVRLETYGLHKDGHEVPIEIGVTRLADTEGLEIGSFIRDIPVGNET